MAEIINSTGPIFDVSSYHSISLLSFPAPTACGLRMTLSLGPIWAPSSPVLASQHLLPVQPRPQGMSPHTLSSQDLPSVSLLLLLPPSHPDNPKPMSVQSLVVFTSGENHPPVQAGALTGGRPLPLTGSILAGFYTPLQKPPVFPSKGHTSPLCSIP